MVERRELPEGWRWSTLGEECEINPRRSNIIEADDNQDTSFIPMEVVDGDKGIINEIRIVPFSKVKKGYTYFEENDVLFAKITPCMQNKKSAIAKGLISGYGFGTTEFHVLRCKERVIPKWVYYFIRNQRFIDEAENNFTGAVGQQRVPSAFLEKYPIIVPPIVEQQKIVDKLDKQMAQIEMMKTEAEKQSERVNNLMNSYLNELSQKYSLSLTSFEKYIVESINGYGERPKGVEEGPIVLRIADVSSGQVDHSNVRRGNVASEMQLKYKLNPGDLIFIRVNGSRDFVGRCILFNNEINEPVLFNDHLIRVRVNDEFIPEFVKIWCKTPFIRRYMADTASTSAGQLTINRSVLNEMPIPKIDKSTQKKVIEYHTRLLSEYNILKKMINCQLNAINQLPNSILNEVFGHYQIQLS